MDRNQKRVIIANNQYATKVEELRHLSYHNSSAFKVGKESALDTYLKWSNKDETGITLLAINESDEAISSLRGNVYHTQEELEENNLLFKNNSDNFISYPVLDMTIAATSPKHYNTGVLSVLRYYMYVLHRHSVKTISGAATKNSSIHKTLEKLGYTFREFNVSREDFQLVDQGLIAKLDTEKLDNAIMYLKNKNDITIKEFPLIIN